MSETVTDKDQLQAYVLRIADNALICGQRLGEWVGSGPQLEEELALANFALDYIGQARALYSYAAEIESSGRSEDDFAFLRDSLDFSNVLLVEQPNGDFARTIARQFLFEVFYLLQLQALSRSSDERLQAIAARAVKELGYHLRHTRQWLLRLGDGTDESHERMQHGINELWRFTGELFSADAIDNWAATSGIGPDPAGLYEEWLQIVAAAIKEATLELPESGWMDGGGKQGRHGEHHGYLLAEMQFLQRAYPGSTW